MKKLIILILISCNKFTNINIKYKTINSELIDASMSSDAEQINTLLNKGADVNFKSTYRNTPLINAVINNKIEIIKLLLKKCRC